MSTSARLLAAVLIGSAIGGVGALAETPDASTLGPGCWNTGHLSRVELPGDLSEASASPDGKWLLLTGRDSDRYSVYDVEKGKLLSPALPDGYKAAGWSSDSRLLLAPSSFQVQAALLRTVEEARSFLKKLPTQLQDPRTGKITHAAGTFSLGGRHYRFEAIDSRDVIFRSQDGRQRFVLPHELSLSGRPEGESPELENEPVSVDDGIERPRLRYNRRTQRLSVRAADGRPLGEIPLERNPSDRNTLSGSMSGDNRFFISTAWQGASPETTVVDLKEGKVTKYAGLLPARDVHRLKRNEVPVTGQAQGEGARNLRLLDLEKGTIRESRMPALNNPEVREDGTLCGNSPQNSTLLLCFDPGSEELKERVLLPFGGRGTLLAARGRYFFLTFGGEVPRQLLRLEPRIECVSQAQKKVCSDCAQAAREASTGAPLTELGQVVRAGLCETAFDAASASQWETLTPDPSREGGSRELDTAQALAWLLRFSKPGGFEPRKHLSVVLGLLDSEIDKRYPAETLAMLAGITARANQLASQLLERYPRLGKLERTDDSVPCWTAAEKEAVSAAVLEFAQDRIKAEAWVTLAGLEALGPVSKLTLNATQRDALADQAADRLALEAERQDARLKNIFTSKLYKFAYHRMKAAYGLPHRKLTDLTLSLDSGKLRYLQLGHVAFEGSAPTAGGFHYKIVSERPVAAIPTSELRETLEWKHDGKSYRSEVTLKRSELTRPIVTEKKGPDYAAMWKGGVFRGMVIAGYNLGPELTEQVIADYLQYFVAKGFSMADAPAKVADLQAYLHSKVSGKAPIHYFLKEAHSDGDEKNLFRLPQAAKVLRGAKRLPGGKREEIELVFADWQVPGSTLLSNREFGQWIKEREKGGLPELVYLNTSCSSRYKAVFEVAAAASPTLINIPTTTAMSVFQNSPDTVMYKTVEAVRANKDFAGIRTALSANADFAGGKEKFIFPDEEEYRAHITANVRTPIETEPKVFEQDTHGNWQPYTIEDEH